MAFDASGDLYVVNTQTHEILRFPGGRGPGSVFADHSDGINDRGGLDFHPYGDLFYAGDLARGVFRITPEGQGSLFDAEISGAQTLGFGREGNLFVGDGDVYRYDNAERKSRRKLASGFSCGPGFPCALSVSPDGRVLYFADSSGRVYTVNTEDGAIELLADLEELSYLGVFSRGIMIYAPLVPGDMDADGDVDLADFAVFADCVTGPWGGPVPPECYTADIQKDTNVDLRDFARLQRAFTGGGQP